jgi:hypothetical protein
MYEPTKAADTQKDLSMLGLVFHAGDEGLFILLKCRLTFTRLYGVISRSTGLFLFVFFFVNMLGHFFCAFCVL